MAGASPPPPSLSNPLFNPLDTIGYFFVVLGSPLMFYGGGFSVRGFSPDPALVLSVILLIGVFTAITVLLFLYLAYDRGRLRISDYTFWIGILLFPLAISGMLTIGRSGFGIVQATSSRYTAITSFLYIAIYAAFSIILFDGEVHTGSIEENVHYVIVVLLVGGILVGYAGGTVAEVNRSANLNDACHAVLDYEHSSGDSLSILTTPNGSIERIRDGAAILDRHDLGPFHPRQSCRWRPIAGLMSISVARSWHP